MKSIKILFFEIKNYELNFQQKIVITKDYYINFYDYLFTTC